MKTEGREQSVEWMRELNKQINRKVDSSNNSVPHADDRRRLTSEEWEILSRYVVEYEFPCTLVPMAYGFAFIVYLHSEIQGSKPPVVLGVSNRQFPFESSEHGFAGQDKILHILEPLTHSLRNAEILNWYGFRPLSRAESYSY